MVQPDLFFLSEKDVVFIELKVSARSSIDQVLKYASLSLAVDKITGVNHEHHLIFIGPDQFKDLFNDHIDRPETLKLAMLNEVEHFDMRSEVMSNVAYRPNLVQIINTMLITFISYQDVVNFMRTEIKDIELKTEAEEIYLKLLHGLIDELCSAHRRLAE